MAGQDRAEASQVGQVLQKAVGGEDAPHHPGKTAPWPQEAGIGGDVDHGLRTDGSQESVEAGLLPRFLVSWGRPHLTPGLCREGRGRGRAESPPARRQGRGAGDIRRQGAALGPHGAGSARSGPLAGLGHSPRRLGTRWCSCRGRGGRGRRGRWAGRRQRHWHCGGHCRAWWGRRSRETGTWDNHEVVLVAAEDDVRRRRPFPNSPAAASEAPGSFGAKRGFRTAGLGDACREEREADLRRRERDRRRWPGSSSGRTPGEGAVKSGAVAGDSKRPARVQRARRISSGVVPALLAERRTVPGLEACMAAKVERMHQHRQGEMILERTKRAFVTKCLSTDTVHSS